MQQYMQRRTDRGLNGIGSSFHSPSPRLLVHVADDRIAAALLDRLFALDGPDIEGALDDRNVRLGGWNAGVSYDDLLDDDRSELDVVYIGAASYGPWLDRHWLVPSASPRLLVHVVDDEIAGALRDRHGRYVPTHAAAVDLAELGGGRPIEAALRIWNR